MTRPGGNSDVACRSVHCPSCGARQGEHCHRPADYRRKPVRFTHLSRRRLWEAGSVQKWTPDGEEYR